MISILLFVVLVGCGLFWLQRVQRKRRRLLELAAKIPLFKAPALPFIGHAYKLVGGRKRLWENILLISKEAEEAGGVLAVWVGPSLQIIVNDPDDAFTVANSCLQKSYFYKMGTAWVGEGLVTADAPVWKHNRKLLNPTFSQHVLDGFLVIFNKQSALLAQDLEPLVGTGEFDPMGYLTLRTLETVCQTAAGISLDSESIIDQKYVAAVETVFGVISHRVSSFWLHSDFIYGLTSMKKTEDEAVVVLHNMCRSVLYKRRAERQQVKLANTSSRRFIAFLDLLLDMAEDGLLTDDQILYELDTIIAAGHDTSSRALISILVLLGSYPEVQEKIFAEIMSVVGARIDLDKDDLAKLVYMEAVIKESLRLSPIAPLIARDVEKEVKLKNYTLPAGSGCLVIFWGIHRLPIWGPDRFEFRPERWLDPASLPKSPGAYGAFSIGKRNCIETAIGISLDSESVIDQKYKEALETVFDVLSHRLSSFWLHPDSIYRLTSMKKTEDEAFVVLHNVSRSVLYKRRAERQQAKLANTSSRRFIAFLDLLLDMAEDGLFTDDQIQYELDTIIAAGHDTSSRALNTILVLLGSYPEVQEKMFAEIISMIGARTDLGKDDLAKLVYTEAVIKESFRVNPVKPVIARDVEKEVKLKNYTLPAGSGCLVLLWGIHRLPIWGPDRFEFRPERWLDPASLPKSPGAYCTFSIGKRNCIGKHYAMMSMKIMIVYLVRQYRITADYSKVIRKYDLLLKFIAGHHISLELRT